MQHFGWCWKFEAIFKTCVKVDISETFFRNNLCLNFSRFFKWFSMQKCLILFLCSLFSLICSQNHFYVAPLFPMSITAFTELKSFFRCFEQESRRWSFALWSKPWCTPSPMCSYSWKWNRQHSDRNIAEQCRRSTWSAIGNQWGSLRLLAFCPLYKYLLNYALKF